MANNTIELTNDKTIGVTFNKSENNEIRGATVTVTGSPTYEGKTLTDGSFNVTPTDDNEWTSSDNNATFKSFMPEPAAAVAATMGTVESSNEPGVASTSNETVVASTDYLPPTESLFSTANDSIVSGSNPGRTTRRTGTTTPGGSNKRTRRHSGTGGSRKSHRQTKNRNSKRRGGRSKRRYVNH